MKRIAAILIASLFVLTAFAVVEMPTAMASTPTQDFSFPYSYGQPQVPSDVGAQGIQGPTVPFSQIGVGNANIGPLHTVGSYNYKRFLLRIPVIFELHVLNGTPSSNTPAIRQTFFFENTTTTLIISGTTNSNGYANVTLTVGRWLLVVNASSTSYISYASPYTFSVSSNFDFLNVFLIPSSYSISAVNNGPAADNNITVWAENGIAQTTFELLNASNGLQRIATAQALSNGSAEFTNVNSQYAYRIGIDGYNNIATGQRDYQVNVTQNGGNFASSKAAVIIQGIFPVGYTKYTGGAISGTPIPAYSTQTNNDTLSWQIQANTTATGGVLFLSMPIGNTGHYTLTMENMTVFLNMSFPIQDVGMIRMQNVTVINVATLLVGTSVTTSYSRGTGFTNNAQDMNMSVIGSTLITSLMSTSGLPVSPYVNNSVIFDSAMNDVYSQGSYLTKLLYQNDSIVNSTLGNVFYTAKNLNVINSTIQEYVKPPSGHLLPSASLSYSYLVNSTYDSGVFGLQETNISYDKFVNDNRVMVNVEAIPTGSISTIYSGDGNVTHSDFLSLNLSAPYHSATQYGIWLFVSEFAYNLVNVSELTNGNISFFAGQNETILNNIIVNNYTFSQLISHTIGNELYSPYIDSFTAHIYSNDTVKNNYINVPGWWVNSYVLGVYSSSSNIIISNNVFDQLFETAYIFNSGSLKNSLIANNTFNTQLFNYTLVIKLQIPSDGAWGYDPIYFSVVTSNVSIIHNTFHNLAAGSGGSAVQFLSQSGKQDKINNNLFTNSKINLDKLEYPYYIVKPLLSDIEIAGGNYFQINGNWFTNLNNFTVPIWVATATSVNISYNNYFYGYPPNYASTSAQIKVPNINSTTSFDVANYTFFNVVPKTTPSVVKFQNNEQLQYLSSMTFQAYGGGSIDIIAPDVNTFSGTPTISYANGLVGGPQPNFTWDGYKYTESVEPSYIQVGANSTKAPSVNLQFNGAPNTAYSVAMYDHGQLIDYTNVTSSANGVVTFTYNPATMPLDPVFELTTFHIVTSGSTAVPPEVFLYVLLAGGALLGAGAIIVAAVDRRRYR